MMQTKTHKLLAELIFVTPRMIDAALWLSGAALQLVVTTLIFDIPPLRWQMTATGHSRSLFLPPRMDLGNERAV